MQASLSLALGGCKYITHHLQFCNCNPDPTHHNFHDPRHINGLPEYSLMSRGPEIGAFKAFTRLDIQKQCPVPQKYTEQIRVSWYVLQDHWSEQVQILYSRLYVFSEFTITATKLQGPVLFLAVRESQSALWNDFPESNKPLAVGQAAAVMLGISLDDRTSCKVMCVVRRFWGCHAGFWTWCRQQGDQH